MMGLGEIVRLSAEAGNRARKAKTQPATVNEHIAAQLAAGELENSGLWFPFVGDATPKGWRDHGRRLFCDMTGIDDGGPALSFKNLARYMATAYAKSPRHGWATVEQGEFQCYVQEFAPRNCTCERCIAATLEG